MIYIYNMMSPALLQHKAVILLHGLEATADICQLKRIIKETDEKCCPVNTGWTLSQSCNEHKASLSHAVLLWFLSTSGIWSIQEIGSHQQKWTWHILLIFKSLPPHSPIIPHQVLTRKPSAATWSGRVLVIPNPQRNLCFRFWSSLCHLQSAT